MNDWSLLQEYVQHGSRPALDQLVQRHIGMVHATACRELGDEHLADDVTQAVFMVLMRRASRISSRAIVGGWLFKTTLFACSEARKSRGRRARRELEAATMKPAATDPTTDPQNLLPQLNKAIDRLPKKYRDAVVLTYLQGKSHREAADLQHLTETAARQRLFRAMNRLRTFFRHDGAILSEAGVAIALSHAGSHVVPPLLAARTLDGLFAPPSAEIDLLTRSTLRRMVMSKVNSLAVPTAAAVILMVLGGGLLHHAFAGAALPATQPAAVDIAADPALIPPLVTADNRFAIDLFRQESPNSGENAFLSPYSISTALAMTWAGARHRTADQLAAALHYNGMSVETVASGSRALEESLADAQKQTGTELSVANSLWPEQSPEHPFEPDYLMKVVNNFGAELTTLDYKQHPDDAMKTINAWVEDKTHSRIKNILTPADVDDMTRLVLVNAIYFKGRWASTFNDRFDAAEDFHLADKSVKPVVMMRQVMYGAPYGDFADAPVPFQMVSLDYFGSMDDQPSPGFLGGRSAARAQGYMGTSDLSFYAILPRDPAGLAAMEKSLTVDQLSTWTGKLEHTRVDVRLPRFKMQARYELKDSLQAMGVTDAFKTPDADFSGMDNYNDLFISKVIHQTFIDVNEKGTEAGAATAVAMAAGGAPQAPPPIFHADHPFLFLIRQNSTGAILFMGRLADPPAPDPMPVAATGAGRRGPATRARVPAIVLKNPKAAAAAALETVAKLRADEPDFVRVTPALAGQLTRLETAAQAMQDDDGSDPVQTSRKSVTLANAIQVLMNRAQLMANQPVADDTKAKALDLAAKMKAIVGN